MITTVDLTEEETALWEDDGPDGAEYRVRIRRMFRETSVEIYSDDDVLLDAWRAR